MFLLHLFSSPVPSYIQKGSLYPTPAQPPLSTLEILVGSMPPDLDTVCRLLGFLNPDDPAHKPEIEKHLAALKALHLSSMSHLARASVLAFRLKFAGIELLQTPSQARGEELVQFWRDNIGPCWESFRHIMESACRAPITDLGFVPKYLSRFAHLYKLYQVVMGTTARNQDHNEAMATLIAGALMKQVATTPPSSLGRWYTCPKMAREVLLAMHASFPESPLIRDELLHVLMLSYDYIYCVEFDERKRPPDW